LLLVRIDVLVESIDLMEETPPEGLTSDQARELESLYGRLTRARREYEGLLVLAAETARDEAAFLGGVRADVEAIRSALGPDQLLIEYFVPVNGPVVVFTVSRDEIRAMESPINATNLASRVRLTRDLMARSEDSGDRLDYLLEGLYEALLEPLLHAGLLSAADELIVVPHRELVYLPFAALRDRTTGRYLVEDFTLRVLPSAAALPVLAQRPAVTGGLSRGSAFAPFADRLPATRMEVQAVIDESGRVKRYVGSRATERAVRGALEDSGLVHLATHGILNVRNPMFSRLELARGAADDPADDGRLEVHELLSLRVEAPLVFLSGCETGTGAAHSTAFAQGEDYATLAQAFLYAGAGNVVATLWPVEDAGAAEFAGQFYRNLTGDAPGVALAQAQRAMLDHEHYRNPYYWAAYQVAGYNGRRAAHIQAGFSVQ
jgi:CHAT domain-containing protein